MDVGQARLTSRCEGSQVTYPMHIILRYEIEAALFDGTLQAQDVPAVWRAKMKQYLGIEPPSDREGCLQDVHWSEGTPPASGTHS